MANLAQGKYAEDAAVAYLEKLGYKLIDRNWRTRFCEIDIVALKDKRVYFVEVKYRRTAAWGEGLEYITSKKLKQMRFAAAMWVNDNDFGGDYSLSAIEVSGPKFEVTNFLEDCN